MSYKNTVYRRKKRNSPFDRFMRINIELSNDVLVVERVYPNLIDLFSNIGGILKVLVFACIFTGMVHNQILFDKYLLRTIFSSEYFAGASDNGVSSKPYSYLDIIALGYCCSRKSDPKKKEFDRKMEVIAERMDIGNIVRGNEYVKLISMAVLKPYHKAILSQYKGASDSKSREALGISI